MSRLGLGCVKLGTVASGLGWRASIRLVHEALDGGVTFFDTADAYGNGTGEHVLGHALRGRRTGVTVATKGGFLFGERSAPQRRARLAAAPAIASARRLRIPGADAAATTASPSAYQSQDFSAAYLTRAVEGSLRRLKTDCIDVYQLHGPQRADHSAIAAWASAMIEGGKIRQLGLGAESAPQALEWIACDLVTAVQFPFGVLDPDAGDEAIPAFSRTGRHVFVRGALGAGLINGAVPPWLDPAKAAAVRSLGTLAAQCGQSVIDLALAYVRERADVDIIVVGTSSRRHLRELIGASAMPLPGPDVQEALRQIARPRQLI